MKGIHLKTRQTDNKVVQAYVQAARSEQHVMPKDGNWQVKKAVGERASRVFTTQNEAIDYAREVAKRHEQELFIHKTNGQIRERNNYRDFPPTR